MKINEYTQWVLQSLEAIIYVAIILSVILVTLFVSIPQIKNALELQAENNELNQQTDELASNIKLLKDLEKKNFQGRLQTLHQNLPSTIDAPYLISTLKQLGNEATINIQDVSAKISVTQPEDKTETKKEKQPINKKNHDIVRQNLDINISGSSSGLIKFMKELYEIHPLFYLKEFSSNVSYGQVTDAKITVESYAFMQPEISLDSINQRNLPKFSAQDEQLYEELSKRKQYDFIPTEIDNNQNRNNPFEKESSL